MKKARKIFISVAVLIALFFAVGVLFDEEPKTVSVDVPTTGSPLDMLPAGQHITMIEGFNPDNPRKTKRAIKEKYAEAAAAGMEVVFTHISWTELEPRKGAYSGEFRDRLQNFKDMGFKPFVQLAVIDSGGYDVPGYLEGEGEYELKDGMGLDGPEFLERFNRLMDWWIPALAQYDVWAIVLFNEPDNNLNEHLEKLPEWIRFANHARDYIHAINPQMAVGITLSMGFETLGEQYYHRQFISASDYGSFNFYCMDITFNAVDNATPEEIQKRLQNIVRASGGRPVIIQEFGCASGYQDRASAFDLSEEYQRKWFASFLEAVRREPRIRAASQFHLVDQSPAISKLYRDIFEESFKGALPPDLRAFVDTFNEFGETMGMIRFEDGSAKPAWNAFIEGVQSVER